MKRVVVTGANGFIGRALVERLLAYEHEVFAVSRCFSDDYPTSKNLHCICMNYEEYHKLSDIVSKDIDWFAHFAWQGVSGKDSKDSLIQADNIKAAMIAMKQAKKLGANSFLFAGSSYQYRMEAQMIDNKEEFVCKNIYGCAKQACADLLRAMAFEYHISLDVVLFTNVFGVGDRSRRSTNSMIIQLLNEKKLDLITGEHLHDWTYIDDAVGGIIAVFEKGHANQCYYIGSRKLDTFKTIILRVRAAVCPEAELQFGAYSDRSYIDYSKIDLDLLYRDTGFECRANFEESIRKTAMWLKEQKVMEERVE